MVTMLRNAFVSFLIILPLVSLANRSTAQNELRTEYRPKSTFGKNFLGIELFGRGLAYSVNYDRALSNKFSVGAGFTYYQWDSMGIGIDLALLPVYGQYYFAGYNKHRGFVSGGASLAWAKAEIRSELFRLTDDGSPNALLARSEGAAVFPQAGIGYEFRALSGFTSRLSAYGQYIGSSLFPWAGIMLGAHF